nr:hypothetical protein CFP56_15035 [Quercus suber]
MKKTVVEVQGYDKESAATNSKEGRSTKVMDEKHGAPTMLMRIEKAANGGSGNAGTGEAVIARGNKCAADFTEELKAIDEAINENPGHQRAQGSQTELNEANNGKMMDMEIVESKETGTDQHGTEIKDIPRLQKHMEQRDVMKSEFNMGWVEKEKANKGRKSEMTRKTAGSELGLIRPKQEEGARPKGTWVRISRPVMGKEEIKEQK